MLITVVICTYRRPDRLDRALAALQRQDYMRDDWELLVVENDPNSAPGMLGVLGRYRNLLPLRHVLEPKLGLSNARNTGLEEAAGEYLAYLDDDAETAPGWLAAVAAACRGERPHFCGGPSFPLYLVPKPQWFLDRYATTYQYGERVRLLQRGEWLGGMNFIVSRRLCRELGGFRTDLGMTGDKIAYGEDTELMLRAWDGIPDLKVLYHPEAKVRHEVRPEQMTVSWNIRAAWGGGRSQQLMNPSPRKEALRGLLRLGVAAGNTLVRLPGACRGHCWRRWVYETFCPWLWHLSRNWYALVWGSDCAAPAGPLGGESHEVQHRHSEQ